MIENPNMIVRGALEPTLTHFNAWRSDLASFAVRAERHALDRDRRAMLERCAAIEAELLEARTDLILELGEAPRAIAGHSRVADVEKALDNIEATLGDIRRRLQH
ncbi:MAG: hypothetical protein ABIY37_14390 [Devosia sp.]